MTAGMEEDRIAAAFAPDPAALALAQAGDIQAACLARAAGAAGLAREVVPCPRQSGLGLVPWLRVILPGRVVYCRRGFLMIGGPGAGHGECRSINAANVAWIHHKPATKEVLGALGFPTPPGRDFGPDEVEAALAYVRAGDRAVCVKPAAGSLGNAVFPHLRHAADIRAAFAAASRPGQRVVVEEHMAGQVMRFFFVKPGIAGIRLDIPANVVGDGRSSVAQLLDRKNAAKRRRCGQAPVILGGREIRLMRGQGLVPADVPAMGRRVFLRDVSNSSRGGDSLGYPAALHPSYAGQIARLCNALLGVWVAAVDVVLSDPGAEARPDNYAVIEINSAPGMVGFHFPWEGQPQDMAGAIIALLLGGGGP